MSEGYKIQPESTGGNVRVTSMSIGGVNVLQQGVSIADPTSGWQMRVNSAGGGLMEVENIGVISSMYVAVSSLYSRLAAVDSMYSRLASIDSLYPRLAHIESWSFSAGGGGLVEVGSVGVISSMYTAISSMYSRLTKIESWSFISGTALVTDGIEGSSTTMLTNATGTGTSFSTQLTGAGLKSKARYSATLGANNAIAATATVKIYGSDVAMASAIAAEKFEIGTLTLSGTGVTNNNIVADTDAVHVGEHYWPYIWMEVTAISGTGAKVQGRRAV